ncbi:MAG: alanine racemase, partial [Chloroflexia bacterium]|nr:alanine racemase [Chloroflexia bacterium]
MATLAPASESIVSPGTEVDTPALVVSEAILQRNIDEMAAFAASVGVSLRPHIKTHKTPQIARLQTTAGAVGITCAKVGEAEVMVEQAGIDDVLLAYPTIGEPKVRRLVALMERAKVTVAIDSLAAAEMLSASMSRHGRTLAVVLEVNTGQNRSGVTVGPEAEAMALAVSRLPSLELTGIMTHEGHANSAPPDEMEAIAIAAGEAMVRTAGAIRCHGIALPAVSVGSTPAARITPTV